MNKTIPVKNLKIKETMQVTLTNIVLSMQQFLMYRRVYIDNKHIFIPCTTDENNKKSWNNIYEAIDENCFKKTKTFTDNFLQICNIKLN